MSGHSWKPQPGEPEKAYAVFAQYMLLGRKRSIDRAWTLIQGGDPDEATKRSPGNVNEWSREWRWTERCADYDQYLAEQALERGTEATVATLLEAKEASLKILKKLNTKADKVEDIPDLTKMLNSITQAIVRLQPKGDPTLDEALGVVLKHVESGDLDILSRILTAMKDPPKQNEIQQ
jgi:hypothetical protein